MLSMSREFASPCPENFCHLCPGTAQRLEQPPLRSTDQVFILLKYITEKSGAGVPIEVLYQRLMDYTGILRSKLVEVSSEMLVELLAGISTRRVSALEA